MEKKFKSVLHNIGQCSLFAAHFYTMNWYVQWISPSINVSHIFKTASSFSVFLRKAFGFFFISYVFAGNTTMCPVQ